MKKLNLLLCLAWLAGSGSAFGQPTNYADETAVANYVRPMLYWPDAAPANRGIAAFRYKHLLYTNDGGIRARLEAFADYYGPAERTRSQVAEEDLRRGLTNNPASSLLGNLLLDIYYDRTVAEAILARQALEKAERAHFGPPIALPAPPGGLIIDNEITAYASALLSNRLAQATYLTLLTNNLGLTNDPPLGYQLFQQRVPDRGLAPASYLSNSTPVSVVGDATGLFAGYKDLVLLYELLRDQGRLAATLARLRFTRQAAGEVSAAEALITESKRDLFIHTHTLQTAFPNLDPDDPAVQNSGLATALAGVSDSLMELDQVNQNHRGQLNPLGYDPDFLVLVQGAFAGEQPRDDTYDAFLVHLADTNSTLGLASAALAAARNSYATYHGFEDELAAQSASSCITYYDRLRDIVGLFPYDPGYTNYPQGAPGSELDQQALSVQAAMLQIRKNQVEIANLNKQVEYELAKAADISSVYVRYGSQQAAITEEIGSINAAQAAANEMAAAAESAGALNAAGAVGHAANAAFQAVTELAKGQREAQKERLAAAQSAEITGIEAQTTVNILLLQMNTLAVDSLSAGLQLSKDVNRLQDLYREKAQLERDLQEKDRNIARRYFADPIHRLAMQADMIKADLRFREAQEWLFFMARALEYKWNQPLDELPGVGQMATLFKLRNADELQQLYAAMKLFDDEHVMSTTLDDRFDWFSVREQFFGYTRSNDLGQLAFYRDPVTGQTNDALGAFRLHLSRLVTNNWIELDFNTVREIENKSFFRGPTYFANGLVDPSKPGYYLDKIRWLKIRLPGGHAQEPVSGYLRYGGTSYLRNPDYGTRDPQRPDRIIGEMTAYDTRHWRKESGRWVFTDGINAGISMLKVPRTEPRLDGNPAAPDVLPSVNQIDVFRERSVAATRWHLAIPVTGAGGVTISNLDDIEIYFYHWSRNR